VYDASGAVACTAVSGMAVVITSVASTTVARRAVTSTAVMSTAVAIRAQRRPSLSMRYLSASPPTERRPGADCEGWYVIPPPPRQNAIGLGSTNVSTGTPPNTSVWTRLGCTFDRQSRGTMSAVRMVLDIANPAV